MRIDGLATFNDNKDVVITFSFPDHSDKPMFTSDYNNATAAVNGNSSANANATAGAGGAAGANGNATGGANGNQTGGGSNPVPCIDRALYRYRPGFLNETADTSAITSSFDQDK